MVRAGCCALRNCPSSTTETEKIDQAETAINALNGSLHQEKPLKVGLATTEPSKKFTCRKPSNEFYIR